VFYYMENKKPLILPYIKFIPDCGLALNLHFDTVDMFCHFLFVSDRCQKIKPTHTRYEYLCLFTGTIMPVTKSAQNKVHVVYINVCV